MWVICVCLDLDADTQTLIPCHEFPTKSQYKKNTVTNVLDEDPQRTTLIKATLQANFHLCMYS